LNFFDCILNSILLFILLLIYYYFWEKTSFKMFFLLFYSTFNWGKIFIFFWIIFLFLLKKKLKII